MRSHTLTAPSDQYSVAGPEMLLANILPGLQRLDALLTQAMNGVPPAAADQFRGLYINQAEAVQLLHQRSHLFA